VFIAEVCLALGFYFCLVLIGFSVNDWGFVYAFHGIF